MFQSNKGMLIKQEKLLEIDVRLSASTERRPELIKLEVIMKINEIDEIYKPKAVYLTSFYQQHEF